VTHIGLRKQTKNKLYRLLYMRGVMKKGLFTWDAFLEWVAEQMEKGKI
jgi:hypothetical protein